MKVSPSLQDVKTRGTVFSIMGLQGCQDVPLESIKLPAKSIADLRLKLSNAPAKGLLLVTGTACPLANEFILQGRSVVGFSFPEYYDERFSANEAIGKPKPKDVVILKGVGKEPARNFEYSTKLLQGLMSYYSNSLFIIETHLSRTSFESTYGIIINTYTTLVKKEEASWLT